MLVKVAWRNIWRHKVRSLVVIIAIALGLWAGVFATAFVAGMLQEKVSSLIRMEVSDLQVHEPSFRDEMLVGAFMPDGDQVMDEIRKDEAVIGASGRIISMVMIGSANRNGAIKVNGVVPEDEAIVTGLDQKVDTGTYFEGVKRNPILISKRTAEDYKVNVRSKVVLTLQDVNGEITAGAFRIVGLFDTGNGMYDEMNAFVRRDDIQSLLGIEKGFHEIAVFLNDHELAEAKANKFQEAYPELEVLPYLDLVAGIRYMVEVFDVYLYFIVGIILVALLFSITNTMLMAVLERIRELGMLMAVGMTKGRVFFMIMLETIFLCMIGTPLGLLMAWGFTAYFGKVGIDLTGAAYGEMGFGSIVYPYMEAQSYYEVALMVVIMALVAAIFPARKALKLKPVEAIRKI